MFLNGQLLLGQPLPKIKEKYPGELGSPVTSTYLIRDLTKQYSERKGAALHARPPSPNCFAFYIGSKGCVMPQGGSAPVDSCFHGNIRPGR